MFLWISAKFSNTTEHDRTERENEIINTIRFKLLDRLEAAVRKATEMPDGAEKYIDQETVLEILDKERKGLE